MKDLLLSFFVIFFPLAGTVLMFIPTVRRELRNLNK
jgi:hypothetical protein